MDKCIKREETSNGHQTSTKSPFWNLYTKLPLSLSISSNVPIPQAGFELLTFAGGTSNLSHKGVTSRSASPTSKMSFSTSAAVEEDKVASSCPSNWLKEGNLSPPPTDTTRRRPSEAGGEGRRLRGLGAAANGALGAGDDAGVAGVDSDCWTAAVAAAFAA